jgi:hypothetical protein
MALTKASYSMITGASINVLDFGATGNGTTDDTAAIQAAVNAGVAQNKAVYFPNGTYIITSTINLPNNIALLGETPRKINQNINTYGTIIKTAADITMMKTTAVMPAFTFGIRIENISFWGNGSTGSALTIGDDAENHLSFGITLRNIDIEYVGNGIKLNGAAYVTYLENITMAGTDRAGSYGIWYRRCQIAECHAMKIENFANLYFIQWSSHISLYDCSASFNVPAIANGNNLLRIYGSYHCNFYGCVWENLADSSGSVIEVNIFEFFSDPAKSTSNRFYNCIWNGIGTSACRVKIGSLVPLGPAVEKTYFENCTFLKFGTVATDFALDNARGTVLNQCYSITGYDGSDDDLPFMTGVDAEMQIYSINGIQFNGAESTFSPALTSVSGGGGVGVAYSAQVGNCYKVDKTVTFNIRMTLSNKGANTGSVALGNLPFVADGGASDTYPVTIIGTSLAAGVTQPIVGYIIGASQQINLFKFVTGSIGPLLDTDLTNTSSILISGTYIAV